ncbi:hypothetical protein [Falsiroseomonas stagni]|uniref:Uncharacterized protein n=1 Tax=Falsiroseomonas stagni DSM 19981 TaxID=1123062 RepID=A0A1I3XIG0_9PROT|nr:hypothetical protein [Falsiroseomonas stagni]SFK19302.1 hypothetical protein SAMN02745775_101345 [Falsiroseomonas stagni DSM 19981]
MILQLDPPLPMTTPKGEGIAHFLIDYGAETHLMWVVFMDEDGSCWTVPNPEVRMAPNWSLGRRPLRPGRMQAANGAPVDPGAVARANGIPIK